MRLRPHSRADLVATGLIGKVEVSSFTRSRRVTPMTDDRLPLAELLAKSVDGDFLRLVAENVLHILMEADVDGLIGAGRHERSGDRTTWRNGYRERTLDTRLGTLNLKIPKLRTGAYFPGFLEPRKTVEKALVAVIQEAWIAGVSTSRVDELVQAMGMSGISKSSVSKLCKDIDERVNDFLKRVGLHIGPSEAEPFWSTFATSLAAASRASSWRSATLTRASRRRSPRCSAPLGSAAACTSCAAPWLMPGEADAGSSLPSLRPPLPRMTPRPPRGSGAASPTSSVPRSRSSHG